MKKLIPVWSCLVLMAILIVACSNKEQSVSSTKVSISEKKESKKEVAKKSAVKNDPSEVKKEANTTDPTPQAHLDKAKEIIKSVSKEAIAKVDAAKKYKMYCAACHGFKGNTMINGAKDLTKSKIDLTESVAQVYHGKGMMTPFKGILKDEEIVAISKFIETFRK